MSKNKQTTQYKQKRLELTNDYVFKRIFAKPKNNQELKEFVKSKPGMNSKLEQWLWLLTGEDEKIKMASEENKTIEKVVEDLDEMSANENERLEAYKRKLEIIDYNTTMAQAEKRGKEEGRKENSQEIARKMKEEGMTIEIIAKITGLTKEEIEAL